MKNVCSDESGPKKVSAGNLDPRVSGSEWDIPKPEVHSEVLDRIQARARGTMINQRQNLGRQCQAEHRRVACLKRTQT